MVDLWHNRRSCSSVCLLIETMICRPNFLVSGGRGERGVQGKLQPYVVWLYYVCSNCPIHYVGLTGGRVGKWEMEHHIVSKHLLYCTGMHTVLNL